MSKMYTLFLMLFISATPVTCLAVDPVESTDWTSTTTGSGR